MLVAKSHDRVLIGTYWHTGARKGEVLRWTWDDDINFEEKWVRLGTRKSKSREMVYEKLWLNDDLYKLLMWQWKNRHPTSPYVFCHMNPKSKFYRKGKSNASFMGDTVESLKTKVTGDKIELGVSGRHRVVKGVRGKPLKKSNAKIADIIRGLKSNGIDIMGVSKLTKKLIRKEFIKEFRRTK